MSLLESNLKYISRFSPVLADRIRNAEDSELALFPEETRSGDRTLRAVRGEKSLYLHSRYNPVREAARTVAVGIEGEPDMIVLGGFGLGYLAEEVVLKHSGAAIVIIERSPELMRAALSARDMGTLLGSGRIDLVVSDRMEDILPLLEGRATRRTSMLLHRPSADLYPDYYANLKNVLHSFLNSKEVNLATLARFEGLWTRNLLRNFSTFCSAPGVRELGSVFNDIPAFVVGAGPSLSRNIDFLKEAGHKGVIIAVDTVYKVLLKHGIIPHFVVAVDPQLINCQYFRGVPETGAILVADSAVYPTLVSGFRGDVYLSAVPFPFASWFQLHLDNKGALSSGGSVSTTGFDLAVQMGCSPITLVGQDMAYSGERIHVRGATGEELWENNANRLTPVTSSTRMFLKKNKTVRIPAFDGEGEVWSDRKFLTFLWWFERKIPGLKNCTVWNATEGGASVRGAKSRKLIEILEELPEREIALPTANVSGTTDLTRFRKSADGLARYLQETGIAASEGIRLCRKMLSGKSEPEAKQLQRLDRIDAVIKDDPVYSSLLSSTLQAVIHSVGEGYGLEGSEAESDDTKSILKQSLALYEAVYSASGEMGEFIERYLLPQLPS